MKRTWIPLVAALLWGGAACSSDNGSDSDADTSPPTDTVADTGGGDTDAGDTGGPVDTVEDTGPLTECDQGANATKKAALLAAQPTVEGRQRSTLTETISWDSLEGGALTCSVDLTFKDSNDNG
ncbi:MAG: hypothetical protein EP329_19705, partial [Deltaproteobacteria bacterium]